MALVTNTSASAFEDEAEAIRAARNAQLNAYYAALLVAGETPHPTQSGLDVLTVHDAETGSVYSIPVSDVGGGTKSVTTLSVKWYWGSSGAGIVGTTNDDPYSEADGGTITATENGAIPNPTSNIPLTNSVIVPFGSANNVVAGLHVGDRVFWNDQWSYGHQGVYVVADLGSVSTPWKLVRAADLSVSQMLVPIVVEVEDVLVVRSFGPLTDPQNLSFTVSHIEGAAALGVYSLASGDHSLAFGDNAQATGSQSVAIGDSTVASGAGSISIGTGVQNDTAGSVRINNSIITYAYDYVDIVAGVITIDLDALNFYVASLDVANVEFVLMGGFKPRKTYISMQAALNVSLTFTFPGVVWVSAVPTNLNLSLGLLTIFDRYAKFETSV